jgi:hypothetical protein
MNTITSLREGLSWATELLEMTVDDVTPEQMAWTPIGIANPVGATYAHAIGALDAVTNQMLQRKLPLFASSWNGKTGISEPKWGSDPEWARRVQVDLPKAREYARAAYAQTDSYIAGLSDADLDRELDLSANGLGKRSLGWCLQALVIGHLHNMTGEISALKGTQGARGYPF